VKNLIFSLDENKESPWKFYQYCQNTAPEKKKGIKNTNFSMTPSSFFLKRWKLKRITRNHTKRFFVGLNETTSAPPYVYFVVSKRMATVSCDLHDHLK
jgi:hypothetical protein